MNKLIFSLFALFLFDTAIAESVSFYNVKLDKPIDDYPTCNYDSVGTENPTCKRSKPENIKKHAVIDVAKSIRPDWQQGGVGVFLDDQRKIEAFYLYTNGVIGQNKIFAELKSLYGKPFQLKYTNLTNMYGAKFKAVKATWKLKGNAVAWFDGVIENSDGSFDFTKGEIKFSR